MGFRTKMTKQRFKSAVEIVSSCSISGGLRNDVYLKDMNRHKLYFWQKKAFEESQTKEFRFHLSKKIEDQNFFDTLARKTIHFFDEPIIDAEGKNIIAIWHDEFKASGFFYSETTFDWDAKMHPPVAVTCDLTEVNGQMKAVVASCLCCIVFAEEPIASSSTSKIETPRKPQKIKSQEEIRVVVLRRPKKEEDHELVSTGTTFKIGCQFDVVGHTRRQWYPSEGIHREIPIAPFVKGKGLPVKPTVYKVVSR